MSLNELLKCSSYNRWRKIGQRLIEATLRNRVRNPFSTICGSLDPEISLRLRPACLRNCVALYARRTFLVNSFDRHSSDKSDNHGAEKGSEETCEGNPSCTREESSLWGTGHGKADVSEPVKRKREKVETTDGSNPVNGRKHALSARGVLRKAQISSILKEFHNNREVQVTAAKHNITDQIFELAFKSFQQNIYKLVRGDKSLYRTLCWILTKQGQEMELFPYFVDFTNHMFPMLKCMDELKKISDLRGPPDLFPLARKMKRRIIYHAGPTNSGKTHTALQSFYAAKYGVYCAPLRLLATEIYKRTNQAGVNCDLLTGEDRQWALSEDEPASHVACTVEMCSTSTKSQVAVIDEIQMMRDEDRGWAWTRALLGLPCSEIHVCGEDTALGLVQRLAHACGDDVEVHRYERLAPLQVLPHSIGGSLSQVQAGDCVVAFSRKELFKIRQQIEKRTGQRCAMVYGGLPPATKVEQASQFNDPDDDCSILVATDAVGMGLNLNIKRIVFSAVEKFDGYTTKRLSSSQAKQIAGRAGRYASKFTEGHVTATKKEDLKTLTKILKRPSEEVKAAGLAPSLEQIELLSLQLPDASLAHLLDVFINVVQLDGENYFMCDLEERKFVAETIEGIPLTVSEQYTFCQAPVDTNSALVSTLAKRFALIVSEDEELTAPMLKTLVRWPPAMPKTVKRLKDLETLHEGLDLYLWLSYRFPRVFVDPDGVRRMQSQLEKVIGAAVASNLTLRQVPTSAEVADGSSSTQDYDDAEWQENLEDRDGMWKRIQEELGASAIPSDRLVPIFLRSADYDWLRTLVNSQQVHLRLDSGLDIPVTLRSQGTVGKPRDRQSPLTGQRGRPRQKGTRRKEKQIFKSSFNTRENRKRSKK